MDTQAMDVPKLKPIRGKLMSEVLTMVHNAPTVADKKAILKAAETPALLHILRHAFCPQIEFDVKVPEYTKSTMPTGLSPLSLNGEARRLYVFTKECVRPDGTPKITEYRKIELLLQLLESLDMSEASLLTQIINKDIKVNGLTASLVESVFPGLLSWKGIQWTPEQNQNGLSQSNELPQDKMSTLSKVGQNTLDQPKKGSKSTKSETKRKPRSNSIVEIS